MRGLISQHSYWEGKKKRRHSHHPAVKAFAQPKLNIIEDFFRPKGDSFSLMSALEVGAGSGHLSNYANDRFGFFISSDFSINMIRMNPATEKLCCDASLLPFGNGSFDCVICTNLLHHVVSPIDVVKEMKRVSKKYVVICEPNRGNPLMFTLGWFKKSERGLLKISRSWLRELLKECGLVQIKIISQGIILPNVTPLPLVAPLTKLEKWLIPHLYLIALSVKEG